ncbi:MAG: sugar phosphate nucleotidyltransferase, partial [bacterium]
YSHFFDYHKANYGLCTIATYQKSVKIDLGVLQTNRENRITQGTEKPTLNDDASMGIYAFNKEIMEFIPENEYFDFPDLINALLRRGQKVSAYPFDGYWLDIGRASDYEVAVEQFEKHQAEFLQEL